MAINKYIVWRLNIKRFGKSNEKNLLKYWPISQLQHQEQAILPYKEVECVEILITEEGARTKRNLKLYNHGKKNKSSYK